MKGMYSLQTKHMSAFSSRSKRDDIQHTYPRPPMPSHRSAETQQTNRKVKNVKSARSVVEQQHTLNIPR